MVRREGAMTDVVERILAHQKAAADEMRIATPFKVTEDEYERLLSRYDGSQFIYDTKEPTPLRIYGVAIEVG